MPVEVPLYRTLVDALEAGRLQTAAAPMDGDTVLMTGPDLPEDAAAMVGRTPAGDCVFYHRGSGLCVIHRDAGETVLPSTCQHFPRLAVRDRRGTFISLTHYCPTAAAMLFRDDVLIEIVTGPAAFPPADYEGLVVTQDEWPPLLRPDMLMDDAAYSAWEHHLVARCADQALSPESVIATLERDARVLRRYPAGDGMLQTAVERLTWLQPNEPVTDTPPAGHRAPGNARRQSRAPQAVRPALQADARRRRPEAVTRVPVNANQASRSAATFRSQSPNRT